MRKPRLGKTPNRKVKIRNPRVRHGTQSAYNLEIINDTTDAAPNKSTVTTKDITQAIAIQPISRSVDVPDFYAKQAYIVLDTSQSGGYVANIVSQILFPKFTALAFSKLNYVPQISETHFTNYIDTISQAIGYVKYVNNLRNLRSNDGFRLNSSAVTGTVVARARAIENILVTKHLPSSILDYVSDTLSLVAIHEEKQIIEGLVIGFCSGDYDLSKSSDLAIIGDSLITGMINLDQVVQLVMSEFTQISVKDFEYKVVNLNSRAGFTLINAPLTNDSRDQATPLFSSAAAVNRQLSIPDGYTPDVLDAAGAGYFYGTPGSPLSYFGLLFHMGGMYIVNATGGYDTMGTHQAFILLGLTDRMYDGSVFTEYGSSKVKAFMSDAAYLANINALGFMLDS